MPNNPAVQISEPRWVNKTIKFDDLKERLKITIRTTESAEEYAKMSRAQRDTALSPISWILSPTTES